MTPEYPFDLEAVEVYLQPGCITQMEWADLYRNVSGYLHNLEAHDIVHYPEKAEVLSKVEAYHIHIQIKRAFTTDVILLYPDLSSYANQTEALILLGVSNAHGRLSTPLIIDLIVLMQTKKPGLVRVKGYLHPEDWDASLTRLQEKGLLPI
ncbi:hypothetical protein [Salibacterium sp. K-3]